MVPLYFRVHYYESEAEDDIILFTVPNETSSANLFKRFEELKSAQLPRENEFSSREDMVDHIFDTLADEFGGEWSYCEILFHMDIGAAMP